ARPPPPLRLPIEPTRSGGGGQGDSQKAKKMEPHSEGTTVEGPSVGAGLVPARVGAGRSREPADPGSLFPPPYSGEARGRSGVRHASLFGTLRPPPSLPRVRGRNKAPPARSVAGIRPAPSRAGTSPAPTFE